MKRTSIAIILVWVLALLFVSSSPVLASWPADGDLEGCYTFDYEISNGGFATFDLATYEGLQQVGTYSAGVGWIQTEITYAEDNKMKGAGIFLAPSRTRIDSITLRYKSVKDADSGPAAYAIRVILWDGPISLTENDWDSLSTTQNSYSATETEIEIQVGGVYAENMAVIGLPGFTTNGANISSAVFELYGMDVCQGEFEFVKPLLASDLDGWGMYEHTGNGGFTVVAFSKEPGAFVRSAVNGMVYSIDSIDGGDCDDVLDVALLQCAIRVPEEVHGGDNEWIYTFAAPTFMSSNVTYKVVIKEIGEERYFTYFVKDAPQYIVEGQVVVPGCYLGKTDTLTGYQVEPWKLFTEDADQGVTIVYLSETAGGNPIELQDYLVLNPLESNPCNVDYEYSDCLGSADLSNQEDWTSQGNVAWNNPGATIGTNSEIRSTMNLDADREPQMRVSAKTQGGTGQIELRIGETVESFEITDSQFQEVKIDGDTHAPSDGIFYDIIVSNTGSATLEIEFICVSFTLDDEGNPKDENPPGNCYFDDPSFDQGDTFWDVTWSNLEPYGSGGAIYPPTLGTWTQAVTLYPGEGGPATYTIRVMYGLDAYASYQPDETDTTAIATIDYDFPAPTSYIEIDSKTFGEIAQAGGVVTIQDTFSIAAETSGDFTFKATLTDPPADVPHLAVQWVCLESGDTTDGSPPENWPGDYDYTEPAAGEDNVTCDVVTRPSGNNLSSWAVWSWQKLNNFFQCELMVLLNQMYDKLIDLYQLIGWVARWLQAFLYMAGDWLTSQFTPWLGGYFDNAKGGGWVIGTEEEEDGGCAWYDIFCHAGNLLDGVEDLIGGVWDGVGDISDVIADTISWIVGALQYVFDGVIKPVWNFLKGAFDWVLNILESVVKPVLNWVIDLIGTIADWIAYIWELVLDTVGAYNDATPQTVPGFPDCDVDTGHTICLFWWVTENTVFAGTVGSLMIPLLASIIAIMFILHYIKQIKASLSETGTVT